MGRATLKLFEGLLKTELFFAKVTVERVLLLKGGILSCPRSKNYIICLASLFALAPKKLRDNLILNLNK